MVIFNSHTALSIIFIFILFNHTPVYCASTLKTYTLGGAEPWEKGGFFGFIITHGAKKRGGWSSFNSHTALSIYFILFCSTILAFSLSDYGGALFYLPSRPKGRAR